MAFVVALLLSVHAGPASAQSARKYDFEFTNVADSTQGFSGFLSFPAINNRGAVAFVANRNGYGQGVFRSRDGEVTTIASSNDGLQNFGNAPAVNAGGVVAFDATTGSGSRAILTGDGVSKTLIADSTANGLLRIGVGSPSINARGTVAFQSVRSGPGFPSSVFTGTGGPLMTVVSTSPAGFGSFQNVAINDAEKIVFVGNLTNGVQGVFTVAGTPVDIVDTNTHTEFGSFGDPVINNAGTIADVAFFLNSASVEIISGNAKAITARNDPANPAFTSSEHPSINNHGAVAFYAFPLSGTADPTGIFLEVSGEHDLIPVIRPGDSLFGSTVQSVDLGRFALNDGFELAFQYSLNDGRSGVAIASFHGEREGDGKEQ
ncbi:MAG TPA: choice-of-anchor tandem repeat NxxGxxAF-containing protein [Bryobacteraceae bacterium]